MADVVGQDREDGERGLKVGILGVEIPEVTRIRVLQAGDLFQLSLVGIQLSLVGFRREQVADRVGFHRDLAAAGVGGQPGSILVRVRATGTVGPRVRLNLDGPSALVRGP